MKTEAAERLLRECFPVTGRWAWYEYASDDFKVRWDTAAMLVEDVAATISGIASNGNPKHIRFPRNHADQ